MDRKQIEHLCDTAQERADQRIKEWLARPEIKARLRADAERVKAMKSK